MRRSRKPGRAQRDGYYIGPVRVPRLVYDAWRVAFRVEWKP